MPKPAHPFLALALLALLVATAAVTAFSGASFSSDSTRTGTVTAGTLTLEGTPDGANPIDAAGMRPGATRTATVTLRNTGSAGAALLVRIRDLGDQPAAPALSSILRLTIDDCGAASTTGCDAPTERYSGRLADLSSAALGRLDAGEGRRLRLTLDWPDADDDPALQGAATTFTFRWELES